MAAKPPGIGIFSTCAFIAVEVPARLDGLFVGVEPPTADGGLLTKLNDEPRFGDGAAGVVVAFFRANAKPPEGIGAGGATAIPANIPLLGAGFGDGWACCDVLPDDLRLEAAAG